MEFTPIERDYEGMAKLIMAFVELYKVAPNTEMVDRAFESQFYPSIVITES